MKHFTGKGATFRKASIRLLLAGLLAGTSGAGLITNTEELYPRIDRVTMTSDALGAARDFVVVRPAGYDESAGDWPVVFLFHGRGRDERSLVDDATARAALLAAGFVTVLPDGDAGWYIDSPVTESSRYETYIREVLDAAGMQYRLSDDPAARGLTGWSMGGYGAVRFALRFPGEFSSVAPMIGVIDYPSTGKGREVAASGEENIFGSDPAVWELYNPIFGASGLEGKAVLLITGDSDSITKTMNDNFSAELASLGINHEYVVLEGGHSFTLVTDEALPLVIEHMESTLIPEPGPAALLAAGLAAALRLLPGGKR